MKDLTHPTRATEPVPICNLEIAIENPRSTETVDPAKIEDLADNIEANGLLTPLIGYEAQGLVMITAGGRRLRALRHLVDGSRLSDAWAVPVSVLPMDEAIQAGHAEQLTHERMSELDELRIFARPEYTEASHAELAKLVGRSARYVAQRRLILDLPQEMVDAVLDGRISVNQAAGLSYLADDPQQLAEMFEAALNDPKLSGDRIREIYTSEVREWGRDPWSNLVTQEEYISAGGKLQADLFAGTSLVLTPSAMIAAGTAKLRAEIAARHPNAAFIIEVDEGTRLYDIDAHAGLTLLTPQEAEEWQKIRYDG